MLRIGLLSLICSMSCGVFGFGGSASSTSWIGGQVLFFVFLALSVAGYLGGLLVNPGSLHEARIDDCSRLGRLDQKKAVTPQNHAKPIAAER